ncbi:hypothetical protein B7494_g7227 [Chlorociboria aeruginascens]|nr:hypothetical protein B7494_g7227 [Chlorociboria aeruginascens]
MAITPDSATGLPAARGLKAAPAPPAIDTASILSTLNSKEPRSRTVTPASSERGGRASFSSVTENSEGVLQSFTASKISSLLRYQLLAPDSQEERAAETAIEVSPSESPARDVSPERALKGEEEGKMLPLTNPHSMLHGFVCPCDGFRGWKSISVGGRVASKSFSDLRAMGLRWEWNSTPIEGQRVKKEKLGPLPGRSYLESLPMELLGSIIDQLATDLPPNGFTARNIDLMALLLTSRSMHSATLATLYNQITIPHSRVFRKFLIHITDHPALGTIVRRLDFSHFNPTGAGQTARERAQTQNLIPATLLQCLNLTPNLREFLAQEHIDDDLSSDVIRKLLCDLPKLKGLDFCACSSTCFRDSFISVLTAGPSPIPDLLPIKRLSFHECTILPSSIYGSLIPRLAHLTHLDVAHTRFTDSALLSVPNTAALTHLNLSKCSLLSGSLVVKFLSTHPAAKNLVYLNLAMDAKSHEMLSSEDITAILPILPSALKSLNLKGSRMNSSHIPLLLPLTKHLEELGLGRHLELKDLLKLFIPDQESTIEEQMAWEAHTLRYIDISDLSATQLDVGTLFGTSCPMLKNITQPFEVMELSTEVFKKLEKSTAMLKRVGWCIREAGRRYWLVRDSEGEVKDTGGRSWKWGANYWGMRKIPVARADVGGMYGLYMFKR